jgi:hypothetical protein
VFSHRFRSLVLLGFIISCLSGCDTPPEYTINDPSDPNTAWRTMTPLSYAQAMANGHCPISLPKEARNIQFVDFYAGYGGLREFVRFEAPVQVCTAHAVTVINQFNSWSASLRVNTTAYPIDLLEAKEQTREAREFEPTSRAHWFDSDTIKNGRRWGSNSSHLPLIYVDLDRGIFYYTCTD